jgi:hypothetical protein
MSHSINPKSPNNCFRERLAIIEADNTWNETFLDLYNDRYLERDKNLNKKLRFFEGYIGYQSIRLWLRIY